MLETAPSLADQIYDVLVGEICDGMLKPGAHLVQERLAKRFNVSRQPIQQAMARLKADGMVEEAGKRGLFVAALDPERMLGHYGVRAALDGWSARPAALRIAADQPARTALEKQGRAILLAGRAAIARADIAEQVRRDDAFHFLIYAASGNPLVASTAEPHWRFLRRAMGDILRMAQGPTTVWRQHEEILAAILAGDASSAEKAALAHVEHAAKRLATTLEALKSGKAGT